MSESNFSEEVNQLLVKLPQELQEAVNCLREIVLSCDSQLAEQVKWNSPAFQYTGPMKNFDPKTYARDLMVLHLRKGVILVVMPTGSKIQQNTALLEGNYTDGRRMITLKNTVEINQKEKAIRSLIAEWMQLLDR